MQWYYEKAGEQTGPVSEEEFKSLIKNGTINYSTLVWNSTMTDWQEYGTLNGASDEQENIKKSFCVECGRSYPSNEMIKYGDSCICAACKPVFFQKVKEGVNIQKMVYAGFWIRTAAMLIDSLVMVVFLVIVMIFAAFSAGMTGAMQGDVPSGAIVFMLMGYIIFFLFAIGYEFFFVGKWGATLGKMVCGLKIVSPDGEKISYLKSLGRFFAKMISGWILYIGYIMVAFDDEKQGLHDRICSTRVVRK